MASEKKSNEKANPSDGNSVSDFLYYDERRLGSFVAQLGGYGALKALKHHSGSGEEKANAATVKAALGVPTVGSADTTSENREALKSDVSLDKEYDPFWINGLDLFEQLDNFGLINRDLSSAVLGSFVLVQGELKVIDSTFSKPAVTIKEVREHAHRATADQIKRAGSFLRLFGDPEPNTLVGSKLEERAKRDAKVSLALLESLPRSVQMRVRDANGSVTYCPIKIDSLTIPIVDLIMNHGPVVQGRWSVFGLYDARPDKPVAETQALGEAFGIEFGNPLHSALGYSPLIRTIGRGGSLHGVTPLMIFRQIGGP